MKILSIRQPCAHLVAHGSKKHRKSIMADQIPWPYSGPRLLEHLIVRLVASVELMPAKLQTGGVVGIAEIADCVRITGADGLRGRTVLYSGIVNLCRLCFGKVLWDCVMIIETARIGKLRKASAFMVSRAKATALLAWSS